MGVLCAGRTDIGSKRQSNQDTILLDPKHSLYLVADGMGGHQGGDTASQLAAQVIKEFTTRHYDQPVEQLLLQSLHKANESIFQLAQERPELQGMGTTAVCLHFRHTHAYIANVGDSRAYLLNHQKLYQLTRDHSVVMEKLRLGLYDRDQARDDPQKNALARSVGFESQVEADLFTYKVAKGDLFLLCSDGLHGTVSNNNLTQVLNHFLPHPAQATLADLDAAVNCLIHLANDNGGKDNISLILVLAQ